MFPPEAGLLDDPVSALASLEYIATQCEGHGACRASLGDVRGKISDLVERWQGRDDVHELIAGISAVSHFPSAPLLVHEMWQRESSEAAELAGQIYQWTHKEFEPSPIDRAESYGMMISVACAEEGKLLGAHRPLDASPYGFSGLALETITAHTYGAPVTPQEMREQCVHLNVEAAPEIEVEPVYSEVPALLLSGGMDMDTSFAWAELAASRLSSSTHLLFPFNGHVVAPDNECAADIVRGFLRDPRAELDTRCQERDLATSRALVLESGDVLDEIRRLIPDDFPVDR